MEMETEDDVAMEGDMHVSSTAAGTIVAAEIQSENHNVILQKDPIAH